MTKTQIKQLKKEFRIFKKWVFEEWGTSINGNRINTLSDVSEKIKGIEKIITKAK